MLLLATNYIPVVVNHLLMAFYTTSALHNCRVRHLFHYLKFLNTGKQRVSHLYISRLLTIDSRHIFDVIVKRYLSNLAVSPYFRPPL